MKDYYRILNVSRNASQEEIQAQYKLLIFFWHPDRAGDPKNPETAARRAKAEEQTKDINEAYQVLGNPVRRAQYDREQSSSRYGSDKHGHEQSQANQEQHRSEPAQQQAHQAEARRRREEQEWQQRQQAEEQRRREEYERSQQEKAAAARLRAEKRRGLSSLTLIIFILLIGYWIANNSTSFRQDQGTISGDLVTRTGIAEVYSEFDVWVKNDSNHIKYVAFVVTGQFEDGTTQTSISNGHSAYMSHEIPAKSTENYSVTFDFGRSHDTVEIIDCHIIVSDNRNAGYGFNEENQTKNPCASQTETPDTQPIAIVNAGEAPQYSIRYIQPIENNQYAIREIDPPTFQSPKDIYIHTVVNEIRPTSQVSLSPGGKIILFGKHSSDNYISVMDMNGGELKVIGQGINPTWAPDNRIAYINFNYDTDDICTMDIDGNNVSCLTVEREAGSLCEEMAAYAPSGAKIAFTTGCNLFFMNNDGTDRHNVLLYSEPGCDSPKYIFWSPDATKLILMSGGPDSFNLCVINTDETGLRKLNNVIASGMPAWSPDGKWIAYPAYPWGSSLEIITVDGTNQKKLLNSDHSDEWFAPFWMQK